MQRGLTIMALLALCVTACDGGTPKQSAPVGKASPPASAQHKAPPVSLAPAAQPVKLAEKIDGFEFSYAWPAEAAAIPALDHWLRGNAEAQRIRARRDAMADKASAAKDGYNFNAHSYDETYAIVGNTPLMLVLLSDGYVYTGGAHGMPINTAILWDKAAGKRLATAQMLDIARLANLSRKAFCAELDRQRAEKRGEPVRHDDPNELVDFVQCVDMTKQLILPVSKGGKSLDTVQVVIGPYEAGPYAEGTYVIDLPMDDRLLAAVKAPYRNAFGKR